jgi:lipoprotein-releasing system permease protein
LNLSYFIAKRISRDSKGGFSATIYTIAIFSMAIGLAAAIVSFLVMHGFQETVKQKMYSFSGHLVITAMTLNNSVEEPALNYNIDLYNNPQQYKSLHHIQEYAHKAGLIKTDDEILGVVVKGVGKSFDAKSFSSAIVEGRFIQFPDSTTANEVVVSSVIAAKLKVKVGDEIVVHFFQNPPRLRKLTITGIYETNLSEYFDDKMIISDIRMVQKLNNWSDSTAGGLEVFANNISDIDNLGYAIGDKIDYDLAITATSDKYYQVFDWLKLLSRQVNILLVIILIVICVNMISIVLILVMERTQMIGMLKAMGSTDGLIRKIFMSSGIQLILRGLFWGNLLGLGVCYVQHHFKIITLNPHDYYMSYVPISWHWDVVLLLNLLMLLMVTTVLLLPTMTIARVRPIQAIKFD